MAYPQIFGKHLPIILVDFLFSSVDRNQNIPYTLYILTVTSLKNFTLWSAYPQQEVWRLYPNPAGPKRVGLA